MAGSRQGASSSLIDLKAELFRKQEEYKQLKARNSADVVKGWKPDKDAKNSKKDIWSKKNAGVLERAGRDMEQKAEEDNVSERSRRALEAKSKIYDKIASSSGIPDDDGSEGYLVDFQKKAVERIVEERRSEAPKVQPHSSDDEAASSEPVPPPSHPEEEWVDYVDTFGRSRRCMKKDLPNEFAKQERPLSRPPGEDGLKLKEGATLLSADMKRELRRQQWEKEAQEAADGPIHYSNVQFDEIRTHGTGFFQFSKDSSMRDEQMASLNKLHEETLTSQERTERIKAKRKAALDARLAKVKQRRKMKEGSALGGVSEEAEKDDKPAEDALSSQQEKATEPEPLTRDDSWRTSTKMREWDLGKPRLPEWNEKRYMEDKRDERDFDFAPPQIYFDKKPNRHAASSAGKSDFKTSAQSRPPPSTTHPAFNADAMLKQIRNSVTASQEGDAGLLKAAAEKYRMQQIGPRVKMEVDPTAIPLPPEVAPIQPSYDHGQSGASTEIHRQAQLQSSVDHGQYSFQGQDQNFFQSQDQNCVQGQGQYSFQSQQQNVQGQGQNSFQGQNQTRFQSLDQNVVQGQGQNYFQAQNQSFSQSQDQNCVPGQDSSQGQHQNFLQGQGQNFGRGYGQVEGQRANVSVPPPGWGPPPPPASAFLVPNTTGAPGPTQSVKQEPAGTSYAYPAQQGLPSAQSSGGLPGNSVVPSAAQQWRGGTSSSFSYPSQQSRLQRPPSWARDEPAATGQRPLPKPTQQPAAKATVPKASMVDKRFMQNREVSEEDMLGYMAGGAADPLVKVEAVAYTPGMTFTSEASTASSTGQAHTRLSGRDSSTSAVTDDDDDTRGGEEDSCAQDRQQDGDAKVVLPAGQTPGVIFGVPDFLQPSADIVANAYQPGSFMAAKEAEAQRAEKEYEVSRNKTRYSGAPVLYGKADDGLQELYPQEGESGVDAGRTQADSVQEDPVQDEVAQFLKDIRTGK